MNGASSTAPMLMPRGGFAAAISAWPSQASCWFRALVSLATFGLFQVVAGGVFVSHRIGSVNKTGVGMGVATGTGVARIGANPVFLPHVCSASLFSDTARVMMPVWAS